MKTIRLSSVLVLFLFTYSQAQHSSILNPLGYNRVGTEFWSSGGAGIAERGLSSMAFNNPASTRFDGLTITAESGWRFRSDYINDVYYDNFALLPSYGSVEIPVSFGNIEIGYSNTYDTRMYAHRFLVINYAQSTQTIQTESASSETSAQTAFASISHEFGSSVSVGLTLAMNFVKSNSDLGYYWNKTSGQYLELVGGVIAQPVENLNLGLTVHYSDISALDFESGYTSGPYYGVPVTLEAGSPLRVGIGASTNLLPQLTLLASAEYQHWSDILNRAADLWQYHFGAVAPILPGITLRAGYFTERSPDDFMQEYYSQQFLSAGVAVGIGENISASVSYMTSGIFTKKQVTFPYFTYPESYFQRFLSVGISWSF